MTLVLLGPPGSGKGTQGKKLATYFHLAYVATGDLVRAAARRAQAQPADRFFSQVQERLRKGRPQPDDVIITLLREQLQTLDLTAGIIFDAFPLSLGQAQGLQHLVGEFHLAEPYIIYLAIDEWESVRRLGVRKFCVKCGSAYSPQHVEYNAGICSIDNEPLITREDDRFHVVIRRMGEYRDRMSILRHYYGKKGRLIELDGQRPIEEVFSTILSELEKRNVSSHS